MSSYESVDRLREDIILRYSDLSKRLQQVAKHLIDYEHDFAIETVATIAERSGVQPSAVVRFAKEFGFDGASAMQRLFREKLISQNASASYRERIRTVATQPGDDSALAPRNFLFNFLDAGVKSLQSVGTEELAQSVQDVAKQIVAVDTVYLAGVRRSFPVSAYFAYALGKAGKKTILIDGVGGLGEEQIQNASDQDMIIATSFSPYAEETALRCEQAKANGAGVALISDSEISPIASMADHKLIVRDAEIFGFRALSSTLCIAQAIVVSYVALIDQT